MPQYAYLLNEEVLALLPTLVVLAVFHRQRYRPPLPTGLTGFRP